MVETLKYPHLFSEFQIGNLSLPNRVVMLPMGTRLSYQGRPDDRAVAFYAKRAAAGVGLIVTGGTVVDRTSITRDRLLWEAWDEEHIPHFFRLTEAVHEAGARIFGQLFHVGREWLGISDTPLLAPSAVPALATRRVPHSLTLAEIDQVIGWFETSARNLRQGGYDGIELHAAHGYLAAQFLSPQANRRTDRYGGSVAGRCQFSLDIAERMKAACGDDMPLGIRISAEEEIEGGLELGEAVEAATVFAGSGLFDYISVAVGIRGGYVKDMSNRHGMAVPLARAIKDASGLPVIASQRITEPAHAEEIISSGAADLVGMARAHVADPDWTRWARKGLAERILPCVGCLQECRTPPHVACMNNPTSGRELATPQIKKAEVAKRVLIVGGGPAGLEAARVSAERGHDVAVVERTRELGGQLRLASLAPNRAELDGVISYRVAELERLGVHIELGTRATLEMIAEESPDVVFVATGARPAQAPQPCDHESVLSPAVLLGTVSEQGSPAKVQGRTAAVLDDGNGTWEGFSSVEFLAGRGFRVTYVTPTHSLGREIPSESMPGLMQRLADKRVDLLPGTAVSGIRPGFVEVYDPDLLRAKRALEERRIPADVVILVGPKEPENALLGALAGSPFETVGIGDCLSPRTVTHALFDGYHAAVRA